MWSTARVPDRLCPDLTTPIGNGILALLSAMAEDERHRMVSHYRVHHSTIGRLKS
jgi:hypothetical protein